MIKPDRIKIEKKKKKAVLDWPVFKVIKKFLGLANYYSGR